MEKLLLGEQGKTMFQASFLFFQAHNMKNFTWSEEIFILDHNIGKNTRMAVDALSLEDISHGIWWREHVFNDSVDCSAQDNFIPHVTFSRYSKLQFFTQIKINLWYALIS